jgi:hypothetical protein
MVDIPAIGDNPFGDRMFDRFYEIQVDTVVISDLDVAFKATKTLKKEPNTLELTVFNLNPDHRDQLQQVKNPVVQIEAGYKEKSGVIFLGDVRNVSSQYVPPDWETVLGSGDGERATQFDRINKSFRAGTRLPVVLEEIANTMGDIGIGNLRELALQGTLPGSLPGIDSGFVNGINVSGNSSKQMDRVVRSAGLEWSIQDKKFQLLRAGQSLTTTAVVLTPDTGMIGSPTIGNDGVLTVVSLMNPDIIPGKQLIVRSGQIDGRFRAEKCTYEGVTDGQPWYVTTEAKEITFLDVIGT